jgi:hypothetical protein
VHTSWAIGALVLGYRVLFKLNVVVTNNIITNIYETAIKAIFANTNEHGLGVPSVVSTNFMVKIQITYGYKCI